MSNDITSARATARFVRVTPMKARRVIDLVRGKSVSEALAILKYAPQGAAKPVAKPGQSVNSAYIQQIISQAQNGGQKVDPAVLAMLQQAAAKGY